MKYFRQPLVTIAMIGVFVLILGATPREAWSDDACNGSGGPVLQLPAAKLIIEHNATDEDTGVHGLFDGVEWTTLCVYDPDGNQLLFVEPKGELGNQSISGIFFESAEPPNDEVSIENLLSRFPEGQYSVRGVVKDGGRFKGTAIFTHAIPAAPVILAPGDGDEVDISNLVVEWEHVTKDLDGNPIKRTGYEVIVTKQAKDDPNGFSQPVLSAHVLPSVNSLKVPPEFLEPSTEYEIEVLALEVSGNQTISIVFVETSK